jgi:hypothetical protein
VTNNTPEQEVARLRGILTFLYPAVIACDHLAFEASLEGATAIVKVKGEAFPVTTEYLADAVEAIEEFKDR